MDYKVPDNNLLSAETLGQYPISHQAKEKIFGGKRQAIDILETKETRLTNYG